MPRQVQLRARTAHAESDDPKVTPLRPVIEVDYRDTTLSEEERAVERYVDMLLAQMPGMPRETVRRQVKNDLHNVATGYPPTTYDWFHQGNQMCVRLKRR